jgi:hypothetical protein
MVPLTGMRKLRILSMGRNLLKKIERLEDVADTLEELWLSYNQITSLDGLASLHKLSVLYLSNNLIRDWNELEKLVCVCVRVVTWVWVCCVCGDGPSVHPRCLPPLSPHPPLCSPRTPPLTPQAGLSELKDVLFVGNPMYEGLDRREAKLQVLKRLPQVPKSTCSPMPPPPPPPTLPIHPCNAPSLGPLPPPLLPSYPSTRVTPLP